MVLRRPHAAARQPDGVWAAVRAGTALPYWPIGRRQIGWHCFLADLHRMLRNTLLQRQLRRETPAMSILHRPNESTPGVQPMHRKSLRKASLLTAAVVVAFGAGCSDSTAPSLSRRIAGIYDLTTDLQSYTVTTRCTGTPDGTMCTDTTIAA